MKKAILCLLLITYGYLKAQPPRTFVEIIEKTTGKLTSTQQGFVSKEYIFPDRIHSSHVDTTLNLLTIQLRALRNEKWLANRGKIYVFDMPGSRVRWSKNVLYQNESYENVGPLLLKTNASGSHLLNVETGETVRRENTVFIHADPEFNIGIGYDITPSKSLKNLLMGINIATGEKLWQRVVTRDYSWNDLRYLNDSTLLIVAEGLHTINIHDGSGWDYTAVTGKKDYSVTIAKNVAGVAVGLLTGAYLVSTGPDLIRDVVSNVVTKDSRLYFASRNTIACIDAEGQVVWSTPLPEKLTSKSILFLKDDQVVMVNCGYAYKGYRKINYGKPFLATFDLSSGEETYRNYIGSGQENKYNGFTVRDSCIYFIMGQQIEKYSIASGKMLGSTTLHNEDFSFLGDHVYEQQSDSTYSSINQLHPDRVYIYTKDKKIIGLDKELKVEASKADDQAWLNYFTKYNYRFLKRNKETIVLDSRGGMVAEMGEAGKSTVVGNKLYTVLANSIIETDVSQLFSQ
ncbi:hypothetical protein [Telluribacter sp.]|jgi:hypothetical protein|uniref:hypothetical protein n=1 Tax=Telluribacter sp. TaxID=1978767 RepID=UPI002E0D927F|nr:hypothetical protein [Telluribacter sp.]